MRAPGCAVRLSSGTKLGRYDVVGVIGAGGMGEVYRAFDAHLNRSVVIKLLTSESLSESEQRKRVLAEARSAAALNHPGIVTVYEVGEHDGRIFLVMELVEGQTLRHFGRSDRLVPRMVAHIGEQVASALAGAHKHGVVHGDIKPENILVLPDGRIKLLDFGISRRILSPGQPNSLTATFTGEGLRYSGTLVYMSPEQLRGEAPDGRSDLFSLGIVLYEVLTGAHPFAGGTATQIVGNIIADPANFLDQAFNIRQHPIDDGRKLIEGVIASAGRQSLPKIAGYDALDPLVDLLDPALRANAQYGRTGYAQKERRKEAHCQCLLDDLRNVDKRSDDGFMAGGT